MKIKNIALTVYYHKQHMTTLFFCFSSYSVGICFGVICEGEKQ